MKIFVLTPTRGITAQFKTNHCFINAADACNRLKQKYQEVTVVDVVENCIYLRCTPPDTVDFYNFCLFEEEVQDCVRTR